MAGKPGWLDLHLFIDWSKVGVKGEVLRPFWSAQRLDGIQSRISSIGAFNLLVLSTGQAGKKTLPSGELIRD